MYKEKYFNLIAGFTSIIAIMAIIIYSIINNMSLITNDFSYIANNIIRRIEITDNILDKFNLAARSMRNILIFNDSNLLRQEKSNLEQARLEISGEFQKIEKLVNINNEPLLTAMKEDYTTIKQLEDNIVALGMAGKGKRSGEHPAR